ncbi:Uma2 family endonuclease [Actinoplanes sp. LDG1-06]|uniref:Uma2 family endonuclease n=1 Tax=Paractinoplanes ovalisporus TaxID=2810368 RepID=A0ABS2AT46_9ACTN|nr:Uma2 family endonuclease [Actinoplanes ovalisporus]MBM2622553.1 Uma2 family endonuclease [Actinoplanes ovalisporus]
MTTVPDWMRPPRAEGWYADDLDHLPDAPPHIELIDGMLVFRAVPQQVWHSRLVTALAATMAKQTPQGIDVEREMTITLGERDRTFFTPDSVLLVGEVESPESAHRDRTVKLRKYAEDGIRHYWRVENETWAPVIHTYELDGPTRLHAPTGIFREELRTSKPFASSKTCRAR